MGLVDVKSTELSLEGEPPSEIIRCSIRGWLKNRPADWEAKTSAP